ncbi:Methyltransferase domain-containing protein [Streptoalloteichus tenebrarius]|uniref:Methyltransferase domain-containing protein n=1 Tax=Streptoalloteichus tenebrarius (strain ATCC 17920 / DSM 40477 / JCM 4838 / CBS 697.72 / NBRC 16177 / NCIMB 11028 / NRRL B-12390 / A12253. 1 / ISP 5477) TaxID=1933 RepID=A0ABT1HUC1_STRSD|nr:class I SAM-dependent methyltransferase [Streptoalloteichus tenebrarius]MCP2259087.1 Methyltransferase domain-containing protein [Streptoalloteichus tenebrarius]BFE99587.1 class I SAM-dependent methyltransferase [Streptoalloteichus tenebrarius]
MPFNHNDHYHPLLLRQVPTGCRRALDVGCGTGRFARRLAARGVEVDALDPAREVIEAARSAPPAPGSGTVRFEQVDITRAELPARHYDFISCLASLHHVPFDTVTKLRAALAPGGVLAVLGCYREEWPMDAPFSLLAVPVNAVMRLATAATERVTGQPKSPQETVVAPVARPSTTLREIRDSASRLLPGSTVRRLLFWRYLLVFREAATR